MATPAAPVPAEHLCDDRLMREFVAVSPNMLVLKTIT
jgi:hypothetical protein